MIHKYFKWNLVKFAMTMSWDKCFLSYRFLGNFDVRNLVSPKSSHDQKDSQNIKNNTLLEWYVIHYPSCHEITWFFSVFGN